MSARLAVRFRLSRCSLTRTKLRGDRRIGEDGASQAKPEGKRLHSDLKLEPKELVATRPLERLLLLLKWAS